MPVEENEKNNIAKFFALIFGYAILILVFVVAANSCEEYKERNKRNSCRSVCGSVSNVYATDPCICKNTGMAHQWVCEWEPLTND
jgi:hypothetical protein